MDTSPPVALPAPDLLLAVRGRVALRRAHRRLSCARMAAMLTAAGGAGRRP